MLRAGSQGLLLLSNDIGVSFPTTNVNVPSESLTSLCSCSQLTSTTSLLHRSTLRHHREPASQAPMAMATITCKERVGFGVCLPSSKKLFGMRGSGMPFSSRPSRISSLIQTLKNAPALDLILPPADYTELLALSNL